MKITTAIRTIKILSALLVLSMVGIASDVSGSMEDAEKAFDRGEYETTLRILKALSEKGDASAQFNLGAMYHYGDGVNQDFAKALNLYRKSAKQGNAFSSLNLAVMYSCGSGVPENSVMAYAWLDIASSLGSQTAMAYRDEKEMDMSEDQLAKAQTLAKAFPDLPSLKM